MFLMPTFRTTKDIDTMRLITAALALALATPALAQPAVERPVRIPTGTDVRGPLCLVENPNTQLYSAADCDGFRNGGYAPDLRPIRNPILQDALNNRGNDTRFLFQGGGE
jgi:hypothetical protein